ncbi:MAG: extracellular solute-binding protein [Blautia sp.]|nr:extracellular solute-binding protein [Blautia sp.]
MNKKVIKALALAMSLGMTVSVMSVPVFAEDGQQDPFGVFEEPVTVTVAQRIYGDAIPTGDDAPWNQKYKEYGINLEVEWSADASQFNNKMNTAIASGETPDLFQVGNAEQMITLVKADMVADLTEVFEEYASPLVKERFSTEAGQAALNAATFDGKLRFIPINITESLCNMDLCYIRQDWVENLGLELPETIEDLKALAIAFTEQDPDGNGVDDTYGLAIQGKDGMDALRGYFTGYGISPARWYDGMIFYSEDEDGNVVWDGEKPEMKQALADLQELYAAGAIAQDFATYDGTMMFEDLNGSKAGITIGARGYPAWGFNKTYVNDPDAKWYAMKMPHAEGTETMLAGFQPMNAAMAVSVDCEHPEAVIRMLNIVTEITTPGTEMFDPAYFEENRQTVGDAFMVAIDDPEEERTMTQAVCEAIEAKDPSGLSEDSKQIYDSVLAFEESGSADNWSDWNRYYPEAGHAYYVIYEMNKDSEITDNLWQALPTEKMLPKLAVWKKTTDESAIQIISGADVNTWDDTVASWNALGGEEFREAVIERLQ